MPWNNFNNTALIGALLSQLAKGGGKGKGKGAEGYGGYRKKGKNPAKTIWVGNLPEGCTFNDLLMHAKQAGDARWAEVYRHNGAGTGAVGFANVEEATQAIAMLNGSMIGNSVIQCDAWGRGKPKK
eukprot:TRINITY_DN1296_c0_g4_i3.p2 TRINITY_DN1296_c0_g4~~TRINITY_DN1296_c0_g4_i3.p2  ORF type:complete len:126 (-),score=23.14 TRINITY_DN1296_c0_g4_i3:130-507(-)